MDTAADSTGGLPDNQDRYLPSQHHGKTQRRRTLNHRVRLAAKRYIGENLDEVPCRAHRIHLVDRKFANRGSDCELLLHRTQNDIDRHQRALQDPSRLRPLLEEAFREEAKVDAQRNPLVRYRPGGKSHWRADRPRAPWSSEEDDGLALARSRDPLPSDRHRRLQRTPSLEREEAFCDDKTFKGKVHVKPMPNVATDDAQVADLYRMGLLYDEGDQRERANDAFNLNDIHHDEPVYAIRPARRGQKVNKSRGYDGPLPLDLSFADLGNDNDLAQFLISPSATEAPTAGDDSLQHTSRRASRQTSAPLRVIYELATARPSFDVDTSQPPDLMNDSLSDYEYLSDSELDDNDSDVPSQREVHDATAATSATGPWVLLGDDS